MLTALLGGEQDPEVLAVNGVQTPVLAFFMNAGQTPVWFRLWADDSGLVHRASMRAQGHFMDHRYCDFDAQLAVEPPTR
jgi:hypothetical protein